MTIEQSLFTAITTDAQAGPLLAIGTSPQTYRLFPNQAPPDVALPFAVYTLVIGRHLITLGDGRSTLRNARIQIDVYDDSPDDARTLADYIVAAIDSDMHMGDFDDRTGFVDDPEHHRITMEFSLWE